MAVEVKVLARPGCYNLPNQDEPAHRSPPAQHAHDVSLLACAGSRIDYDDSYEWATMYSVQTEEEEPKVSARHYHGHATTTWSTVKPHPLAFDYIPEHRSSFKVSSIGLPTRPRRVTGGGRQ
ncbi:hypothetical protein C8J57DRAFT_1726567 [Mycena rebaudengoi]|nr:hypothetical protein C8J57DRAFT_1726567 [Mycena rebaudengoi]